MDAVETYTRVDLNLVNKLKEIVGAQYVMVDEETLSIYAHDETENLHFPP